MTRDKYTTLGIFINSPELFKLFNLYELTILKNYINWFSNSKHNMTKVDFDNKQIGAWISNSKCYEWGMTPNQLSLAITKLSKPKGKNKTRVIVVKKISSTSKNKDHYKLHYGWEGSRRFVIINPIVLYQIISWNNLGPRLTERYMNMLKEICHSETINKKILGEAQKNFYLEDEKTNANNLKISNKIKSGLKNKENEIVVNEKLNDKTALPSKEVSVPKKQKEKVMEEPSTVFDESEPCTEEIIMAYSDLTDEEKQIYIEQLHLEQKMGFVPKNRFDPVEDIDDEPFIRPVIKNPRYESDVCIEDTYE